MIAMAPQINSVSIVYLTVVYLTVCSGADQRKRQSSASLALWGEFTDDRGKCFHLITSSWFLQTVRSWDPALSYIWTSMLLSLNYLTIQMTFHKKSMQTSRPWGPRVRMTRTYPPNTWRNNNVAIMSIRSHCDIITSKWHPHYVTTTSFLRNYVKMTSFWRKNDVSIA